MALVELASHEPASRLTQVQARDGYGLHYRVWTPASDRARATLVFFNGMTSHSAWFQPLAGPLLDRGFKLVGADRRGTGENDVARGDAPDGKTLIDDAVAIVRAESAGGGATYLAGWCWGAILAINVAAEIEGSLAGLALLAPGLFPTDAIKRRLAEQARLMKERSGEYPSDQPCVESPISDDMFTTGPALDRFIARDARRLTRMSPRFLDATGKLGLGARLRLPKLRVPLLLVLASEDRATDNRETERGFAQMTAGRVAPRYVAGAHGLQFDAPGALAATIAAWIDGIDT